jgi:lysophospholipase L1-like esterase
MQLYKRFTAAFILTFLVVVCCNGQSDSGISFLALGDSYTIGESVSKSERWPEQLVDSIRKKGIAIQKPQIIAKTGWTTDELLDAINKVDPPSNYDLVSLLIGVNNQYRGYNISKFRKEFKLLLEKAISFADGQAERVFVISIPDYGVTPFGQQKNPRKIARQLNRYNQISKKISESHNVSFINITPISKRAKTDTTLTANDGLHPSGKMYRKWVSKILPFIITELR